MMSNALKTGLLMIGLTLLLLLVGEVLPDNRALVTGKGRIVGGDGVAQVGRNAATPKELDQLFRAQSD